MSRAPHGVDLAAGTYTWGELLAHAERVLVDTGGLGGGGRDDARRIVERASGLDRAGLVVAALEPAPARATGAVVTMLERRVAGEPLQYALGSWGFRGLDLLVDRRVLIPRPETETVAEIALEEAARLGARRAAPDAWATQPTRMSVADLGTGSGALALSLASELADVEVWAVDDSEPALAVARANLAAVGLAATRVRLVHGAWFDGLPPALRGSLALVVSNPPYVAAHEVPDLPVEVREHEPVHALVSGPTGLEALEAVIRGAGEWLAVPGSLVVEHAPHQAEDVLHLARDAGFDDVAVRPDLAGRPRALVARRCG